MLYPVRSRLQAVKVGGEKKKKEEIGGWKETESQNNTQNMGNAQIL